MWKVFESFIVFSFLVSVCHHVYEYEEWNDHMLGLLVVITLMELKELYFQFKCFLVKRQLKKGLDDMFNYSSDDDDELSTPKKEE